VEPRLRPGAEAVTYVVRRGARNRALVTRSDGEAELTLLEWARLRSVDWTDVARVILIDALAEPPVRKLAQDYGRFLFTPSGESRAVTGLDIGEWLSSWSLPRFPGEAVRDPRR
jgi:hypothetical protein